MRLDAPGGTRVSALYDRIGRGYAGFRRPDPRIGAAIHAGLDGATSVLNVGAGAGSYEPADRTVLALEPSRTMIHQRSATSAPVVQGVAEALPFRDDSFGASMAVLTIHHWSDPIRGVRELRRVARGRVVILTWDPAATGFWLSEYLPDLLEMDRPHFLTMDQLQQEIGAIQVSVIPIPHDCTDGFLAAYWRRPDAYLDSDTRGAVSSFARLRNAGSGLERLRRDLESGAWARRHDHLLHQDQIDLGYRLVVSADSGQER